MAPKRKSSAAAAKPAKKERVAAASPEANSGTGSPTKVTSKLAKMTVSDVWSSPEYVKDGHMSLEGFANLNTALELGDLSFPSFYLSYLLGGSSDTVDDVMVVCRSKSHLERALQGTLRCKTLGDAPAKLTGKCGGMQVDYGEPFQHFFRWLFEVAKAMASMQNNLGAHAGTVRSVPVDVAMMLMEPVLQPWALMAPLKTFCAEKHTQPFTKDLWLQIGRFAHMTQIGIIKEDLSNYDDDEEGGGSAWPSAIDDFVEFVLSKRS